MRVLFFTKPYIIDPLGIGYLSAVLKQRGHVVGLEHNDRCVEKAKIFKPDVICFSVTTGQHIEYQRNAIELKRDYGEVPIVFGGPHPTYFPRVPVGVDAIVRGEAELSLPWLLEAKQYGVIDAFHLVQDIDSIPPPDRGLMYRFRANKLNPIKNVMSSRGCPFRCPYCVSGDTKLIMKNGSQKEIKDITIGDTVVGAYQDKDSGRWKLCKTKVLNKWKTRKKAYRITFENGDAVVCSADHRWLVRHRGWKYTDSLTTANAVKGGFGASSVQAETEDFKRGYISGMISGDGTYGVYNTPNSKNGPYKQHQFRLSLKDEDISGVDRVEDYLCSLGVFGGCRFKQDKTLSSYRITNKKDYINATNIVELAVDSTEWRRGFLSGIFDAEGSAQECVIRIFNYDEDILGKTKKSLDSFGFAYVDEQYKNSCRCIRILGGIKEYTRFFRVIDSALPRKFNIDGKQVHGTARVVGVESLGYEIDMYDITTESGTFIANGFVAHNCYNSVYNDLYKGQRVVRYHSVERVIGECEEVKNQHGAKFIFFADDEFAMRTERLKEITKLYETRVGLPYHAQLRIDLLTDEKAAMLARSGCRSVTFAVESGDERYRREVLGRKISNEQIIEGSKILHRHGIGIRIENMVGLPGETIDEAIATLDLNMRCRPELAWASLYQPYPGTILGDKCIADGLFAGAVDDLKPSFFEDTVLPLEKKNQFINLQRLFGVVAGFPSLRRVLRPLLALPPNKIYGRVYSWWKGNRYDRKLYVY